MANPEKYERGFSFSGYQANNPTQPLPGDKVDIELDEISRSLGETVDGLGDVRRSDGQLNNEIVHYETLDDYLKGVLFGSGGAVPPITANDISSDLFEQAKIAAKIGAASFVPNLAALRNLQDGTRAVVLVLGHDAANDGGMRWVQWDANSVANDDNATVIRPNAIAVDAPGRWLVSFSGPINVYWFGAKADNSTINTVAIQAAIDFAAAQPYGATVFFPRGIYLTDDRLFAKSNVKMVGEQYRTSIIRTAVDNKSLLVTSTGSSDLSVVLPGDFEIENIEFQGYNDRNAAFASESSRMLNLKFERVRVTNVGARYSRFMSITITASDCAWVERCQVEKSNRDGINVIAPKKIIRGNVIKYCGDDGIACHSNGNASLTVGYDTATTISDNILRFSGGIRSVGGRNITITGNSMRFISYTFIGVIYAPPEGLIDTQAVVISGNSCQDLINATYVTNGTQVFARGILVQPMFPSSGLAYTTPVPPAQFDFASKKYVKPELWWNWFGGDPNVTGDRWPRSGACGVSITGNVLMNTLYSDTDVLFSSFGFGQLWKNGGFVDPTMKGTIHSDNGAQGVVLFYTAQNYTIQGNNFYGMHDGIVSSGVTFIKNLSIVDNDFTRCYNGAVVLGVGSGTVDLNAASRIEGNRVDLDPYFETPHRNADGSWNNTGLPQFHAFQLDAWMGIALGGNDLRNCKGPLHMSGAGQVIWSSPNTWRSDPTSAKGMNDTWDITVNSLIVEDSDPNSPTYGAVLSAQGNPTGYTSVPATGYFKIGQLIRFTQPTIDGNGYVAWGCVRLTTGSAHVVGTDWAVLYSPTSTASGVSGGSKTMDWGSVAAGASASTTLSVPAAVPGSYLIPSMDTSLSGCVLSAYCYSAGNVAVILQNPTGGAVDLPSATLKVRVVP